MGIAVAVFAGLFLVLMKVEEPRLYSRDAVINRGDNVCILSVPLR